MCPHALVLAIIGYASLYSTMVGMLNFSSPFPNRLKTSSLFKSASGAAGKMGKVTAETSFKNVGAGAKFSLSGFKSSSPSLGGPFYVNKKIVR
mmetsp:Transcript_7324/g.10688  ORF Transcript_7324/g.10688 Transcript_7324/m.10688 type:complete len:93 (+) Transcript_7324:136-414(+)